MIERVTDTKIHVDWQEEGSVRKDQAFNSLVDALVFIDGLKEDKKLLRCYKREIVVRETDIQTDIGGLPKFQDTLPSKVAPWGLSPQQHLPTVSSWEETVAQAASSKMETVKQRIPIWENIRANLPAPLAPEQADVALTLLTQVAEHSWTSTIGSNIFTDLPNVVNRCLAVLPDKAEAKNKYLALFEKMKDAGLAGKLSL